MELKQLKYFVVAAETLNFSKAAKMLFVSQPTLSLSMTQLEDDLGVKLFIRGKNFKACQLTPAGEYLLPKAKEMLKLSSEIARTIVMTESSSQKEIIKIGFNDRFDRSILTKAVGNFSRKYPEVELQIDIIDDESAATMLQTQQADLYLTLQPVEQFRDDLSIIPIKEVPLYLAIEESKADEFQNDIPSILEHLPLYLVDDNAAVRMLSHVLQENGFKVNIKLLDSWMRVFTFVDTGKGVTIMHEGAIESFKSTDVRLLAMQEYHLNTTISAVILESSKQNEMLKSFMELFSEE